MDICENIDNMLTMSRLEVGRPFLLKSLSESGKAEVARKHNLQFIAQRTVLVTEDHQKIKLE